MSSIHFRRFCAGLAALSAVAVSAVATATPAAASGPGVTMIVPDTSVATGGTPAELKPSWYADEEVVLQKPRLTYTLTGLEGVTLSTGDGVGQCENAGPTQLLCSDEFEFSTGPDGMTGWFTALLTAGETAVAGASGTVTATFEAEGAEPVTQQAAVRVVGAVDLAGGPAVSLSRQPGAAFDVPLVVRNAGRTVAQGAAVIFNRDYSFEGTAQFSNCRYRDGEVTACVFDQELQPGATLRGVMPYKLRTDTYAPGSDSGELQWLTPAELEDHETLLQKSGQTLGVPGTGEALTLQGAAAAKQSQAGAGEIRQADTNPDNNWATVNVRVTGVNGADLVAIGAELTGAAGDVVTAEVGVRNAGPATIDFNRSGEPISHVAVTIPAGATVIEAPEACSPDRSGRYLCFGGSFLPVGGAETYEFKLRITTVVPDARGPVVVNGPCQCSQFTQDTNPSNNTAAIVLNRAGSVT